MESAEENASVNEEKVTMGCDGRENGGVIEDMGGVTTGGWSGCDDSRGGVVCRTSQSLKFFYINIQCLGNKIDELALYLELHRPDVVCMAEHWCVGDDICCLNISEYIIAAHYSRTSRLHGGTVIYIRQGLNFKTDHRVMGFSAEMDVEMCAVELTDFNTDVICMYRPSTSNNFHIFLASFEKLADYLFDKNRDVCILGDFNIDLSRDRECITSVFENVLSSYGLRACVTEPTRGNRCIDNVFTNLQVAEICTRVVDPALSDHSGVLVEIRGGHLVRSALDVRYVNRVTRSGLTKLIGFLSHEIWPQNFQNASEQAECLTGMYIKYFDICFPLVKAKKDGFGINWFDDSLRAFRSKILIVNDICNITKDPATQTLLKSMRKEYRSRINIARRRAYDRFLMNSSNPVKAGWKLVNSVRGGEVHRPPSSLAPGDFCRHFAGVADRLLETLPESPQSASDILSTAVGTNSKGFFLFPVTEPEVARVISSLSNSTAPDVYGLASSIIKETSHIVLPFLTTLINNMFLNGEWPDIFKKSRVTPVLKKGDEGDPGNYRPIAIVPVFSKIAEVLLYNRLMKFFSDFKLFSANQYGFLPGRSTISAVSEVVGGIVGGIDQGELTKAVLCDLTRAFDCVSHEILCQKMQHYGVRGVPLQLLKSYLTGRTQCVRLGGGVSDFERVHHGIPQGSVLGPLLFVIYVNDLPQYMRPVCQSVLYADDTTLLLRGTCVEDLDGRTESALRRAEHWLVSNKLHLNHSKTQSIVFSSNYGISKGHSVKLLGVTLDDHLRWEAHVSELCKKLSSALFLLRTLRGCINHDMLLKSYYAFIHSRIQYGVVLWGNRTIANRVLVLQKRAIRIIYKLKNDAHCKPFFKLSGIMTVPALYIYHALVHIHENRLGYQTHADVHPYNTRNKDAIVPARHRYFITQKNSLDISVYNGLPSAVREQSVKNFKKTLKNYLVEKPIYKIGEFCMPAPPP